MREILIFAHLPLIPPVLNNEPETNVPVTSRAPSPLSLSLVIIPTYNERENIEQMLRTVLQLEQEFHVLVVDDNSPDGTQDLVRGFQKSHPEAIHLLARAGKQGLGTAYLAGFRWALERSYQYIFEMDADFSHNPEDLPKLFRACHDDQYDMAVGSRYVKGVNVVNWPISRVLLSYFASRYVRTVLGIPVEDTTAGFVCYRREVLERINFKSIKFVGYAFQIEMKFIAYRLGFKIIEVPVIFTDRTLGTSKMSKGIIGEAVFGVLRLRLRQLLRRYR